MAILGSYFEEYEEDHSPGEHLESGEFDPEERKFCLISGKNVLFYDTANGKRLQLLKHSNLVIGAKFYVDMLLSITDSSELYIWEIETQKVKKRQKIAIPRGYETSWAWIRDCTAMLKEIYLLLVRLKDEENDDKDCLLVKLASEQLTFDNNECQYEDSVQVKFVAYPGKRPTYKKCLDIADNFYVKCEGRVLTMGKFCDSAHNDDVVPNSDSEAEVNPEISKAMEFVLTSQFKLSDQGLAAFDGVCIVGDLLFATVNVGRVYSWTRFKTCGIASTNCSHVTLTGHRVVLAATASGTMYIGTGKGVLYKYNLSAASGAGRWHRVQQLDMESPPRSLMLNRKFTILIAVLSDNSVYIINTSMLKLAAKAEVIKLSQTNWLGIVSDPANPEMICTTSRIGHLQWFDPLQWKTKYEFDVSEEGVVPMDTFNFPSFLWLDIYSLCVSIPRIVTCECRRNDPDKTFLKIWRRSSLTDAANQCLEMEDCLILPRRVLVVRSTFDAYWAKSAMTTTLKNSQQFLVVYLSGEMDVYVRDPDIEGRWRRDVRRHNRNWQKASVRNCSSVNKIRHFSTVNTLNEDSYVLIWNMDTMEISHSIDTLKSARQAEWSPFHRDILLIACHAGITAFDVSLKTFVWCILQTEMKIYANHIATFAYDDYNVFPFDPIAGVLTGLPLKFTESQKQITAVAIKGNVWFCGLTINNSFALFKPAQLDDNTCHCSYADDGKTEKSTAFSQLFANGETRKRKATGHDGQLPLLSSHNTKELPSHPIMLMDLPLIRRFVDGGSAPSLVPITHLARQFVQACLSKKLARFGSKVVSV